MKCTDFPAVKGVKGDATLYRSTATFNSERTFPNPRAVPSDTTTGTITMPASLGTIWQVAAGGVRNLVGDPGELLVGLSAFFTPQPSYDYTLATFDFEGGGPTTSILARAEGTSGGVTYSINRGVGFDGTNIDFSLIDIPIGLSPTVACGGDALTFSWTGV